MRITLEQAKRLVEAFGDEDDVMVLSMEAEGAIENIGDLDDDIPSPAGLWAHVEGYPEESYVFLPNAIADPPTLEVKK